MNSEVIFYLLVVFFIPPIFNQFALWERPPPKKKYIHIFLKLGQYLGNSILSYRFNTFSGYVEVIYFFLKWVLAFITLRVLRTYKQDVQRLGKIRESWKVREFFFLGNIRE